MTTNDPIIVAITELAGIVQTNHTAQMQAIEAVEGRVGAVEKQFARMNGEVASNVKRLDNLPCTQHGEGIARLQERAGLQPTPREAGATEAAVEQGQSFRDRAWQIVSAVLVLILTIVITLAVTGAL